MIEGIVINSNNNEYRYPLENDRCECSILHGNVFEIQRRFSDICDLPGTVVKCALYNNEGEIVTPYVQLTPALHRLSHGLVTQLVYPCKDGDYFEGGLLKRNQNNGSE